MAAGRATARLLQMRMLELWREPEVIFWVFVFPLLLALGLGIAFRDKPADVTPVAVVEGPKAQQVIDLLQRSPEHAAHSRRRGQCGRRATTASGWASTRWW